MSKAENSATRSVSANLKKTWPRWLSCTQNWPKQISYRQKALEEGNAVISALEADIQKHIAEIHAARVQFNITPVYPYDSTEKLT